MSAIYQPSFSRPRLARGSEDLDASHGPGVRMTFSKDEEIYGQGEDADLVYRVLSGGVRTVRVMADGRRQIGGFYRQGQWFGFETGAEHRFSAEALGASGILVIKRSAFETFCGGDERPELVILQHTTRELDRAQAQLLLLACKTACEKVVSFLLMMADEVGGDRVDLPMGRQDIADYLGLTIETVSRMLTQLQRSHLIDMPHSRQVVLLDRDALMDLSE